jgi:hypothetical protein
MEENIKTAVKPKDVWLWAELSELKMATSGVVSKHGNETSDSVRGGVILEYPADCWTLKE